VGSFAKIILDTSAGTCYRTLGLNWVNSLSSSPDGRGNRYELAFTMRIQLCGLPCYSWAACDYSHEQLDCMVKYFHLTNYS
jgi:hypothetical protein